MYEKRLSKSFIVLYVVSMPKFSAQVSRLYRHNRICYLQKHWLYVLLHQLQSTGEFCEEHIAFILYFGLHFLCEAKALVAD